MPRKKNVIVSCAITGSLHTPSMSEYLPITPNQIASEALSAAQEGAAIIHLHARDPENGRPTAAPEVYELFLPRIHDGCDAIINMTTGGAPGMTMDERLAGPERFSPEMCSLNMGSINNGLFAGADRIREFKYDWEEPFLRGTKGSVFENTFTAIETTLKRLGQGQGARFEFECYDISHLNNLRFIMDQGLYEGPIFLQFVLGVLGGTPANIDHLLHLVRTAERLFGSDVEWSVIGVGRHQMPMATQNALLGGHVRVGLEDSLYLGAGELAKSNAHQVAKIVRILKELGLGIASPDEARERLALKGRAATKF